MFSTFRSEPMGLFRIYIPKDIVFATIAELGELGLVELRDLNATKSPFERKFYDTIQRCNGILQKLVHLEKMMEADKIQLKDCENIPLTPDPDELSKLEEEAAVMMGKIYDLYQVAEALKQDYLYLREFKQVLEEVRNCIDPYEENTKQVERSGSLLISSFDEPPAKFTVLAGSISTKSLRAFEIMLWRVGRGNLIFRQRKIITREVDADDFAKGRSVFVILFYGNQLKTRLSKICTAFHVKLFDIPDSVQDRTRVAKSTGDRLADLNFVLQQTKLGYRSTLASLAQDFMCCLIKVKKMRSTFYHIDMLLILRRSNFAVAECWIPLSDLPKVQISLAKVAWVSSSLSPMFERIPADEIPPTFTRVNAFTMAFQNIINAYGIASYREINPAVYTVVTFPFLFGIMFGDAGHGLILAIFGLMMILNEKQLRNKVKRSEIASILFSGRYMILMMGLFSIYTGLIYNDVFSKPLNIFGSHWRVNYNLSTILSNPILQLNPASKDYLQNPYPFGNDPVWLVGGEINIPVSNSFKMKISVVLGVLHMIVGLFVGLCNHIYFKDYISLLFEFIPQLVFMLCLFFYFVLLIFFKWSWYGGENEQPYSSDCAPFILITFIDMVLFKESEDPIDGCKKWMYSGQLYVQKTLVFVALLCVPFMLLGKPLYILRERRRFKKRHAADDLEDPRNFGELILENTHEEPMSEIFIYATIHTIESVLGSISHTASYLRLWALALAHAQLSAVVWHMVLNAGFVVSGFLGGFVMFFAFGFWAILSVCILVAMEGLSAFLHTLRLHWIEFQSKFYIGAGYAFQPFSFETIFKEL